MEKKGEGKKGDEVKAYLAPDVIMLMLRGSRKGIDLMRKSKESGGEMQLVYSPFGLYEAVASLESPINPGWLAEFLATCTMIEDGLDKSFFTMTQERREHLRRTALQHLQDDQDYGGV
jgi:hypothetical protein